MYLAVDIGGTKTLLCSFSKDGEPKQKVKFPTPQDYEEFLKEFEKHLPELGENDFLAGAAGVPGVLNRQEGVVLALGNLPWRKEPIQADLEKIAKCPFVIENDAKLAGLSEARLVLKNHKKAVYVTVSTGIGSVSVVDGVIDPRTIDSEVGHMTLEHKGKFETWEDFASGRAIVEQFGKKVGDINEPEILKEIARNIAVGLIVLIATLTPDVIILGGGVGTHLPKYQKYLDQEIDSFKSPMLKIPKILAAQRPEEAVIYGCYELVKGRFGAIHAGNAS